MALESLSMKLQQDAINIHQPIPMQMERHPFPGSTPAQMPCVKLLSSRGNPRQITEPTNNNPAGLETIPGNITRVFQAHLSKTVRGLPLRMHSWLHSLKFTTEVPQ